MVTVGVFDGVHRGHRLIIGAAVERARAVQQPAVVLTFDPHPSEVVRPGSHPAVLTGPRLKSDLVAAMGVDVLCVIPFTAAFSRLPAEDFVHEVLVEHLHTSAVVVGENFRFGHGAAGNVATLDRLGHRWGFSTVGVPLLGDAGEADAVTTYSSTAIRALVAGGDVEAAAVALGRQHRVEGVVVRGDARGRALGFPTANVEVSAHAAVPADGVYAGWLVRADGEHLTAAISVGTNPTFQGRERRVEAFVLDFDADLYGEHVAVDFRARLRPMERFPDAESLAAQIRLDVEQTRRLTSSAE